MSNIRFQRYVNDICTSTNMLKTKKDIAVHNFKHH